MGRLRSETAILVFAVCGAVALGITCGAWINGRLASAASGLPHVSARLTPAAARPTHTDAPGQTASASSGVAESLPADSQQAGAAAGAEPSTDVSDSPPESRVEPLSGAEGIQQNRVRSSPGAVAPFMREERRAEKASRSRGVEAAPKAARPRGGTAVPCALYTSAGAVTIRGGGAATLILGGPGEAGRVSVSTPDWSDIAVFNEGRASGNGWSRFSVRSVSGRAGVYTAHFKTACGSQSITVTVKRQ